MKLCDVIELQKNCYKDPSFIVDYFNVGRGFTNLKNKTGPRIIKTIFFNVWNIINDELIPIQISGVFYNAETYLIQWRFECILEDEVTEKIVFFYWKGSKATKGLSPLPPNCDNETSIVNRLVQWSEPPVFFHIFLKPIIVFDGKYSQFDPYLQHLFMVGGELLSELHLYEVPFLKQNLRSRGVFLIVIPSRKNIFIWKGSKIMKQHDTLIEQSNLGVILRDCEQSWKDFSILETTEYKENYLFEGDNSTYWHVKEEINFSPRLFYMNSISGEFLVTEIEYPLRCKDYVAAFPFLQSHLNISEDQPGLFLLDNNHKIWLISSNLNPSKNLEELNELAMETARRYAKEKEKVFKMSVPVNIIKAGEEPLEFINIFPFWN